MKTSNRILIAMSLGCTLLALGAAAGWWWANRAMPHAASQQVAAPQAERKVLYWYDPMYPQQRFDQPGKSPFMDMELVPKYADEAAEGAGVKIDPVMAQNLGLRLAKVERIPLSSQIEASGLIGFNERDVAIVQSRTSGFVERVWPLAPGDLVKTGQPLVSLLVPEWAAAQHELLAVRTAGDSALLAAARERLRLLGMPEALIREVEQSGEPRPRYTVTLSSGGLLQSLDVRPGMTMAAGQPLARINGLASVWLEAAVPEASAGAVHTGANAEVHLAAFPGQPINGRVTAILPMLNEASRSLRVRVELPNRDGRLRPGLSARVLLASSSSGTALAVPTEAVIRTGKRALVMVAGEQGRYLPVEVVPGQELGNRTVIVSGLEEGQQIVASGQFLIDSEASISGVAARAAGAVNMPALHEAEGTIKAIDGNAVTLSHGPFQTLGMPGMTMEFPLASASLARGFAAGDRVRVGVREADNGLIIERLEKIGGAP
jgi:Cu(I)/Ag(I) efflux system membrane fusion protein